MSFIFSSSITFDVVNGFDLVNVRKKKNEQIGLGLIFILFFCMFLSFHKQRFKKKKKKGPPFGIYLRSAKKKNYFS